MPLEIRELVIKATVGDKKASSPTTNSADTMSGESTINEIVEKVLEIIREKNER